MAAKLPLVSRKNIRDEHDGKISEHITKIKEYTGEDYEVVTDFNELFTKIDQNDSYQKDSIGMIAWSAVESLVGYLKTLTEEGDNATFKEFFNTVVSSRKIKVLVADLPSGYNTVRVVDGVLELVYRTGNYGTNTSYIAQDLQKQLDAAFAESNKGELPLTARIGFQKEFLERKDKLEAEIVEELLDNKVTLVVDPADIWKVAVEEFDKLKKRDQGDIDMESISRNMGAAPYNYFEGLKSHLNYKFKQDDMMVEALLELMPKKEIHFKLVPKGSLSSGKSYNDAVFEDDCLVIRATPQTWYTNSSYACEGLENLL